MAGQHKVSDAFEALDQAWNAGDADGIAAGFASECVLVSPYGTVTRGREAVRKLFQIGFSAALKGSSRRTTIESVSPIADSVMSFLGSVTLCNFSDPSGNTKSAEKRGILTGVAQVRNERCEVLSAQLTYIA